MTIEQKVKCAALEVAVACAMRKPEKRPPVRAARNILELSERISGLTLPPSPREQVYNTLLAMLSRGVTPGEAATYMEEVFGLCKAPHMGRLVGDG